MPSHPPAKPQAAHNAPRHHQAELLLDMRHELAECGHWSAREEAYYWTNIQDSRLWRYFPASGRHESWPLPERLSTFALCAAPRYLLLGLASRLAFLDRETRAVLPILPLSPAPGTRLNDGKCDRAGHFVFGMQDETDAPKPVDGFYRLRATLELERLPLRAAATSNSIAFSPDGTRMYYCDSQTRTIRCCDYDPDGDLRNDREFARLGDESGVPDGSTVDDRGGLWNAHWGGHCLVRYDPDGTLTDRIAVPTAQPTCPAFVGQALDTLYITSAHSTLDDDARRRDPHAGGIFVLPPMGFRGLPEPDFQGQPPTR